MQGTIRAPFSLSDPRRVHTALGSAVPVKAEVKAEVPVFRTPKPVVPFLSHQTLKEFSRPASATQSLSRSASTRPSPSPVRSFPMASASSSQSATEDSSQDFPSVKQGTPTFGILTMPLQRTDKRGHTTDDYSIERGLSGMTRKKPTVLRNQSRKRGLAACFVINDYTNSEWWLIQQSDLRVFKYIVAGQEVGGLQGRPHIQGYASFTQVVNFAEIQALPGWGRAQFVKAFGSPDVNAIYCKKGPVCNSDDCKKLLTQAPDYGKDAVFFEVGELPGFASKKKGKLAYIAERLQAGDTMRNLYMDPTTAATTLQFGNQMSRMRSAITVPRSARKPSKTFYLWGKTGCGKSRTAFEFGKAFAGEEEVCMTGSSEDDGKLKWFGNYDGHRVVVIDDWRAHTIPLPLLLRLLDAFYPMEVNVKYGLPNFCPDYIFITAPYSIEESFERCPQAAQGEDLEQLHRRIHGKFCFGKEKGMYNFEKAVRKLCKEENVDASKIDFTDYQQASNYSRTGFCSSESDEDYEDFLQDIPTLGTEEYLDRLETRQVRSRAT